MLHTDAEGNLCMEDAKGPDKAMLEFEDLGERVDKTGGLITADASAQFNIPNANSFSIYFYSKWS